MNSSTLPDIKKGRTHQEYNTQSIVTPRRKPSWSIEEAYMRMQVSNSKDKTAYLGFSPVRKHLPAPYKDSEQIDLTKDILKFVKTEKINHDRHLCEDIS